MVSLDRSTVLPESLRVQVRRYHAIDQSQDLIVIHRTILITFYSISMVPGGLLVTVWAVSSPILDRSKL